MTFRRLSPAIFIALGLSAALRADPPPGLDFPPLKFVPPAVETRLLSNGATVFILADHELPLVNVTAVFRGGSAYEPADRAGLTDLAGTMIRAGGTRSRKPEDMDETLEFIGASVETGIGAEQASASLSVLKKDLKVGLEIFADVLRNPAFRGKNLAVEKAKMIEGIRRRNDDPFGIARRELRKMVYGPDHPLAAVPEIPAVKKYSRKDVEKRYERYFHPDNMRLAVSGDADPDEIVRYLEEVFQGWKAGMAPLPEPKSIDPRARDLALARTARLVGYAPKDLNQTTILLAHLGIKRHNPDRFALEVLNEILGGSSLSSRLFKEVRSRRGLAYWVGSSFSEPWDYGTIAAGCQTKSESAPQAARSILAEIERMRTEKVGADELELAKQAIANSFIFRYASSHAVASERMSLEFYGYPPDYLDKYVPRILAVTADDILDAAKKYLRPGAMVLMAVGPSSGEGGLKEFGIPARVDIRIPE